MKRKKILYFSYDGLLEPLGQSQILNYQYEISKYYEIFIVSFEKLYDFNNLNKVNNLKKEIKDKNIYWHPLIFSDKFKLLSYIINYLKGILLIYKISINNNINIVHCRGYVTYIIIYLLKYFFKFKITLLNFFAEMKKIIEKFKLDK